MGRAAGGRHPSIDSMEGLLSTWNSWTPLHVESFGNNVDLAISYDSLDEVNKLDGNGRPPLQVAVENMNFEVMVELIEHGASFEHVTVNGMNGNKVFGHPHYFDLGVKLLPHVSMPQNFLSQAASHAGYTDQPGLVEAIVRNQSFSSSVLNAYDSIGLTPVHYAVLGGSLESIKLMVDTGGGITTRLSKNDLSYPVHYACSKGDEDVFAFLQQCSFMDPSMLNSQDICGRTPFHLAMYNGHWKLVAKFCDLLESCNASILDSDGHSVQGLLFQMRNNHSIPRDFLTAIPCLTQDEADWLLHAAISDADQDLLHYALMQKANANCFDLMQQSPLMHAAKLGYSEMCLTLLEYGADQSIQDFSGYTALHFSSRNGHFKATRSLLQFPGADCLLLSVDAHTPLDMAFMGGHLSVAGELLQAMKQVSLNEIPHWVQSLDIAVSSATTSLLRQLVCHFPRNWIGRILDGGNEAESLPLPSTTHRLVKHPMLRKYVSFPPLRKIYARDLKKLSNVRNKQKQHIKDAKQCKYKPFQSIFKTHKKLEASFRMQRYGHYYPIHEALNARNKDAFLFLFKASQDAGMVDDFLACKGIANVTVAQRLSEILPSIITECGIECDVYQCLLKVFVENNKMTFPLSLLHHIVSEGHFISKKVISYSSVHQWPDWFLCKHLKEFSTSLGIFDDICLDDIYHVSQLVHRVLDSAILGTMDIMLLVYCAVVNGVSPKIFEALLEGVKYFDLTQEILRRWPLTEAIRRGYYDLARLLLAYGQTLCAENGDEDFQDEVMFSFHLIFFAHEFDFAQQLLKLFTNEWLATFLLSRHGEQLLNSCLLYSDAFELGNFLIDKYMYIFALSLSEGKELAFFSSSNISFIVAGAWKKSPWAKDNLSLALLSKFVNFCKTTTVHPHYPVLHQLCGQGQSEVLRAFLDYDFLESSSATVRPHYPVLHQLCGQGQSRAFHDEDSEDSEDSLESSKFLSSFTPIYCAAAGGHFDVLNVIMSKYPTILENQNSTCFGALFYLCYSNYIRNQKYSKSMLEHFNLIPPFVTASNLYEHDDPSVMADFLKLCIPPCADTTIDEESADRLVYLLLHTPNFSSVMPHLDEGYITEVIETGQQQSWFFSSNFFTSSKPQNFSDWLLKDSFYYNSNPSCEIFKFFVEKVFARFPPFNPVSIVRKGLHEALRRSAVVLDDFAHSHIHYKSILKKWQLAVIEITRLGHGELALCILKNLNSIPMYHQTVFNLNKLLAITTTRQGFCAELLEYLLEFHPPTSVFISTVKCAATRGNIAALEILVAYNKTAIESDFTSILCAASKSGHSIVIKYFYDNQYSTYLQEAFTYYHNSDTTFWMTVFKNAIHSGQKELALSALGKMPFSAMASLAISAETLRDICWWGMTDVLSTLCVEDSRVFLESSDGCTPFQAALDSGHIGKMSEIDSFPTLFDILPSSDIETLEQSVTEIDLACRFSFGWLRTIANRRESADEYSLFGQWKVAFALPVEVLDKLSNLYFFLDGLASPNGYGMVCSYIQAWGKQASGILYYLCKKHSINTLELAVGGGNTETVHAILQILYDAQVVSDFINLSIFRKVLLKNDIEVLELLKQFCDPQIVVRLRNDQSGETMLHIVSEHSQSPQCAHVVLSMIKSHITKLVNCLDRANMSPLQCAISLGRYYVAQELLNYAVQISDEDKKLLVKAFGWFNLLMNYNAVAVHSCAYENCQAISVINEFNTLPSIREKEVAEFYSIFKNIHSGIAESVMAASCGILPLHGLDYSDELTGVNFSSKPPTWSRQKLIDCVNSMELWKWCKINQFESVINIIRYIISNDESDLLNATIFHELFLVACSMGSLKFVEYIFDVRSILPSGMLPNSIFVEGFVTAIGLGQLEIAAYIMLHGNISPRILKQELLSVCEPPFIVNLIFFTSATDILNILQNVVEQGESSRILVSQVWLMHNWGEYQIELIERRIRQTSFYTSHQLEIDLQKALSVSLSVDVACFPNIEAVSCPFSKLVVILSSCISHFVPIWRCPPLFTLIDVPEDGIATLSCDPYSTLPRYDISSYNYSIVLTFDKDTGLFEWPMSEHDELNISDLSMNAESSHSVTHLFTIPCQQLVEQSCKSCLREAGLFIPIHLNLDSISSDCNQSLLSAAMQCTNDVLNAVKLHHCNYNYSLYTELGIVSAEFLSHYQHKSLPLKCSLRKLISKLSIEFTLGTSGVTTDTDATGILKVCIGIEANADEGHICPSHNQITDAVGSSLVRSELSVLSNKLSLYLRGLPYPIVVCSYDEERRTSADLTLPSELPLKDILILRFLCQIEDFIDILVSPVASCDDSSSALACKIFFNTSKTEGSCFDKSKNTFNLSILDILPNRNSNVLAVIMRDYNKLHTVFDSSRPVAITSYVDLSENMEFFSSQKNGIAKICNLEGNIIETAPLECTKHPNRQHLYVASARVNGIHIQNSPLIFLSPRVKKDRYMKIPLVVSHPGGGCSTHAKPKIVMNSNYTSIRSKIPPLKLLPPKSTPDLTRSENVHYIGYVFGKREIAECIFTSRNINICFFVSKECQADYSHCEIMNFFPMGRVGVYQMSFSYDSDFVGSVVAICSSCHCAMKIHSGKGYSYSLDIPFTD